MSRDPNYPRLEDIANSGRVEPPRSDGGGQGTATLVAIHLLGLAILGAAIAGVQEHYLSLTRGVAGALVPDGASAGSANTVLPFRVSVFISVAIAYAVLTGVRLPFARRAARGHGLVPVYVVTALRHLVVAQGMALALLAPDVLGPSTTAEVFPQLVVMSDPPDWMPNFLIYPLPLVVFLWFFAVMTHTSAKRSLARALSDA